jgi:O-antigen ligase
MSNAKLVPAASYAAFLGAAVLLGAAVARIPWQLSLMAGVAGLAVLGLVTLRTAVSPALPAVEPHLALTVEEDRRLRPARLAYYVGAATIGFLTVRPALGFTASDWIFLAALGVAALVILTQGITLYYLIPRAVTVGVLLFALGGLLSSIEAVAPYGSALVVVRMLYLTLAWFWLGTVVLQTRSHVQTALVAWVCSAALSSSGALIQFLYGDVIPGGTIAWGRTTGFTEHPNVLGGLAATAFVPALMLAVDSPRRGMRIIGTVSTALIAAGLLLSGSVGGLLAATVATMVWLALRGVSLRILVSGAVVLASALVLMSATGSTNSPSPIDRIQRVTAPEQVGAGTGGTIYTRIEGYDVAWSRIVEQPLVGVGLDQASSLEVLGEHTLHSLVLGPWLTAGVLGLVGIVLLIAGALSTGLRVLRRSPPRDRSFDAALLAALVAFIQHGMGEPILFVRYGWFPTALLIALSAQQIQVRARFNQAAGLRRQRFDTPSVAYGRRAR